MWIANRTDEHELAYITRESTPRKHLITRLFSKPMSVYLNCPHMSMFVFSVFGHRFLSRLQAGARKESHSGDGICLFFMPWTFQKSQNTSARDRTGDPSI